MSITFLHGRAINPRQAYEAGVAKARAVKALAARRLEHDMLLQARKEQFALEQHAINQRTRELKAQDAVQHHAQFVAGLTPDVLEEAYGINDQTDPGGRARAQVKAFRDTVARSPSFASDIYKQLVPFLDMHLTGHVSERERMAAQEKRAAEAQKVAGTTKALAAKAAAAKADYHAYKAEYKKTEALVPYANSQDENYKAAGTAAAAKLSSMGPELDRLRKVYDDATAALVDHHMRNGQTGSDTSITEGADMGDGITVDESDPLAPDYGDMPDTIPAEPAAPEPAPAAAPAEAKPPQGARQAPDGNWYVSDPNRPGKYLQWRP